MDLPGGSDGKESACNAGDMDSIPGLGRSPGEGKGYPSSILAWRIPWTCKELDMTDQLSMQCKTMYMKYVGENEYYLKW